MEKSVIINVFVRTLVFVVILLYVMYHFIPSVEQWCHERWDGIRTTYGNVVDFMNEESYQVPLEDRRPNVTVTEFYNGMSNDTLSEWSRKPIHNLTHVPERLRWSVGKIV
jgi:hypothetical protein